MQRLITRTTRASRTVSRQRQTRQALLQADETWQARQALQRAARANALAIRAARHQRHEDWALGPLTPRRDAGPDPAAHGATSIDHAMPPEKPPRARRRWLHLDVGDRVVLLRGRQRGAIGVVEDVDVAKDVVRLRGLEQMDVRLPRWLQREGGHAHSVISVARPVAIDAVRLVYALPDAATGVPRDVVIERLCCAGREVDRQTKTLGRGHRYVAGTSLVIPWPENVKPEPESHAIDMADEAVERRTLSPVLLGAPFPASVLDELRGKYSRFRTRHEPEFVARVEAQAAREEGRKSLVDGMRTPAQELVALRRSEKPPPAELTKAQLARIGEVIAQERANAR